MCFFISYFRLKIGSVALECKVLVFYLVGMLYQIVDDSNKLPFNCDLFRTLEE